MSHNWFKILWNVIIFKIKRLSWDWILWCNWACKRILFPTYYSRPIKWFNHSNKHRIHERIKNYRLKILLFEFLIVSGWKIRQVQQWLVVSSTVTEEVVFCFLILLHNWVLRCFVAVNCKETETLLFYESNLVELNFAFHNNKIVKVINLWTRNLIKN